MPSDSSFPCPSQVAGAARLALGLSACLQVFAFIFWKAPGNLAGSGLARSLTMVFQPLDGPDGSRSTGTFLWPLPLRLTSNGSPGYAPGLQTHLKHQTIGSHFIKPILAGLGHILLSPQPGGPAP